MNDISETIFYGQRIAISAPIKQPVVWRCTKVEQISPKGISHLTFAQTLWDEHLDYIEKDEDGNVVGIWCNYYKDNVPVQDNLNTIDDNIYSEITFSGAKTPQLKIGGSAKTFTVTFYREGVEIDHKPGTWSYEINDTDATDLVQTTVVSDNQIKIKFIGEDDYIGEDLTISYSSESGIKSSVKMNLVGI